MAEQTNATRSASWPREEAEILARYAVLAYEDRTTIEEEIKVDHATDFVWFESIGGHNDTQAFACEVGGDLYIAFRGTQELRDFLTDVKIKKVELPSFDGKSTIRVGARNVKVHRGFSEALDAIWSRDSEAYQRAHRKKAQVTLSEYLRDRSAATNCRIWLTGHSLGGALATIAAARIQLSDGDTPFKNRIAGLITIGSPRVLDRVGANALKGELKKDKIYRIYRTLDPIPAIPRLGYKHVSGERSVVGNEGELVIGARGSRRIIATVTAMLRALEDAVGSALPGQHKGLAAFIADHDKEGYYQAVKTWQDGNRLKSFPLIARGFFSFIKLVSAAGLGAFGGSEIWTFLGGSEIWTFLGW